MKWYVIIINANLFDISNLTANYWADHIDDIRRIQTDLCILNINNKCG